MKQKNFELNPNLKLTTNFFQNFVSAQDKSFFNLSKNANEPANSESLHSIPLTDLFLRFRTNPETGLSSDFLREATQLYGKNRLTPAKQPTYFWLLFKELFMGFNCFLWLACLLAFLAYKPLGGTNPEIKNLALGFVLSLVITLNSILNVYQKLKSIKIVDSFTKFLPNFATVRRNAKEQLIPSTDLVPGDIVIIRTGDRLPADCRFIKSEGLKVNRAMLPVLNKFLFLFSCSCIFFL